MTERESAHELAALTARYLLLGARTRNLDVAATLITMEMFISITIMTLSIMQGNEDHRAYFTKVLDVMTERCVANMPEIAVFNIRGAI